jgi:hypothetical protein
MKVDAELNFAHLNPDDSKYAAMMLKVDKGVCYKMQTSCHLAINATYSPAGQNAFRDAADCSPMNFAGGKALPSCAGHSLASAKTANREGEFIFKAGNVYLSTLQTRHQLCRHRTGGLQRRSANYLGCCSLSDLMACCTHADERGFLEEHTGYGNDGDGFRFCSPGDCNTRPVPDSEIRSTTLQGCEEQCKRYNWCRGVIWKNDTDYGDPLGRFRRGACQLLEELVSQTTSIPDVLSLERRHGAHGHSRDFSRPGVLEGAKQFGDWFSGRGWRRTRERGGR